MATIPEYSQYTTAEDNLLKLLAIQATPNPPIGQEDFKVLAAKAILNLFAAAGGTLTEAQANGLYAKLASNLADLPNKEQALANIGGAPNTPFLQSLASLAGGIVVKRNDGTAVVRTLVSTGSGVIITEAAGNSGNPTITLDAKLQQVASALLGEGSILIQDGGQLIGVSAYSRSFGSVPTVISAASKYVVASLTQPVFVLPILVDGDLFIEGDLVNA